MTTATRNNACTIKYKNPLYAGKEELFVTMKARLDIYIDKVVMDDGWNVGWG